MLLAQKQPLEDLVFFGTVLICLMMTSDHVSLMAEINKFWPSLIDWPIKITTCGMHEPLIKGGQKRAKIN